jgi:hypothetical protein
MMGLSLLPDLDILIGLPLGDPGRFHNLQMSSLFAGMVLALLVGIIARMLGAGFLRWSLFAVACYSLHLIMDSLTGGDGVMLFWPFSDAPIASPIRLFFGLQWSSGLWSWEHLLTLLSESLFAGLVVLGVRRLRPASRTG